MGCEKRGLHVASAATAIVLDITVRVPYQQGATSVVALGYNTLEGGKPLQKYEIHFS